MMNALISGASVAGPALAYWLHCHGMRATVVERAETVRPGGLAIDFRGSAMIVLERMGILDELRAHATNMGDATIVDAVGTPIATLPGEIFAGELEVMKSDLTRILYDLTRHDTEYVFGDSISAITQRPDGVLVDFERGESRTFDLVVGADGLHSRVRALAFGPEAEFVASLGYLFASFGLENYLNLEYAGLAFLAGDRSANIFSSRHNADARAQFMFPTQAGALRGDIAAQKRIVSQAYAGVGWEVPKLLAALARADDLYFDEMSQVRLASWSTGRVALLGDAGYCASPLSGRGTSQALIGAYVLAGELATHGDDHEAAFAEYERTLRDYVEMNHEFGRQAAESFLLPPSQELFDAMAEAGTGDDSHDHVSIKDYPVPSRI